MVLALRSKAALVLGLINAFGLLGSAPNGSINIVGLFHAYAYMLRWPEPTVGRFTGALSAALQSGSGSRYLPVAES
jgi:hypothetical protein